MPFVVEQVQEPFNSTETETTTKDPLFSIVVVSLLLIYFFRGIVFSLLKFGFIGFLAFTLFKFIT
jgi:hypothetical protein